MLTFYEGLPRAGKSYSAVKDEIVPALKKGRKVLAYIEGLDHIRIAAVAEIELENCRENLQLLKREEVKQLRQYVKPDMLIVIDEAQNFWRHSTKQLDDDITQFVAEHGHMGLDIILMGQSIKDLHLLWRRRVERKVFFQKKTALGQVNKYSATFFSAVLSGDDILFEKVMTVDYEYDPRYFGTYKSHTDDTTNKETKVEQRAVIWNHPIFKRWLPLFAVFAVFAIYYLWHLMHGGLQESIVKKNPAIQAQQAKQGTVTKAIATDLTPVENKPAEKTADSSDNLPLTTPDMVLVLSKQSRIRLLGFWRVGQRVDGLIQWVDGASAVKQEMTFKELHALGWTVFVNQEATVAQIIKGSKTIYATSWSVDGVKGKASDEQVRQTSGKPDTGLYGGGEAFPRPGGLGLVDADSLHRG